MQKRIYLLTAISYLLYFLSQLLLTIFVQLPDDSSKIVILDIGQGDSMLVKTSNENYGLVDTGRISTSSNKLANHLPKGVRSLKFLILTHPDADHIEDTIQLIKRYDIETIFILPTDKKTPLTEEIYTDIANLDTKIYSPLQGDTISIDEMMLQILWPTPEFLFENRESNEESISFILTIGEFSLVNFGDLSGNFELKAARYLKNADIDVLKVSHHGSKSSTSRELLDLLKPEYALISAGADNPYGHPHKEVIQILQESNVSTILSTASHGDISIEITKNGYKVY